jgi:hypothetical protein
MHLCAVSGKTSRTLYISCVRKKSSSGERGGKMKLPVSKTFDGREWCCFEEEDIRRACQTADCGVDDLGDIEECIDSMRTEDNCGSCLVEVCQIDKGRWGYQAVGSIRPAAREKGRE